MTDSSIYAAFAAHLANFVASLSPPVPCAYPGVHFTPPGEGLWLEAAWFANRSVNYGVGDDGPTLHQGFFQVSVCDRPGHGIVPSAAMADAVIAGFPKGTQIGPASVYEKPSRGKTLEADEKLVTPVSIYYRAPVNG